MFVKIRLLGTIDETIQFCEQLRDAGASLIAIHARHRVNLVGRTGPGAREGAAKLEWVAQIRQAVRRYCGCQSPSFGCSYPLSAVISAAYFAGISTAYYAVVTTADISAP